MQTATADPLVGRVLEGRYRIRERIARGGMSTVYSAVDERLDRLVAVKVMSGALSSDPAFADRFAREARAAARLSHLNAVSVYDQGTDGQLVFLVMELVTGRTLRDLVRERGALAPPLAVSIMEPVLSALSAAHRAGLVHRDVKPENILLSDDGVVKVADFGLARAVESDIAATRTGLMMGTVAYCAPEQVSRGQADQRSDVYSAGVVLFELLTGEAPYRGDSPMAVAYQHVHSRVPAPSSRGRQVPEALDELVIAATDSDPAGRPADAGAFLAELHDVRTALALPVVAVPPRPRPPSRPAVPAHPPTHPAAAATQRTTDRLAPGLRVHDTALAHPLAQPAPGPVPTQGPPAQVPPRAPVQPAPPRKRRRLLAVVIVLLLLLGAAAGYAGWWFASGRYKHIPHISGEPQAAALTALHNAGIKNVSEQWEYDDGANPVAKGLVLRTEPPGGSRLLPSSTVVLVLSNGPHLCALPNLAGKTEAQARQAIAGCGFPVAVAVSQQAHDTVPKGQLIGTSPPAGTQVRLNQQVTLVVSSGPPILTVPVVTNHDQDDATNTLQNAGFKVAVQQAYSDTVPEGQVVSQDPAGGSQQTKFSTITITVSQGPPLVTIPQIAAGAPVDAAKATLTGLGLKVKVKKEFGGVLGEVVGIDPLAGTQVRKGDTVTLYVV